MEAAQRRCEREREKQKREKRPPGELCSPLFIAPGEVDVIFSRLVPPWDRWSFPFYRPGGPPWLLPVDPENSAELRCPASTCSAQMQPHRASLPAVMFAFRVLGPDDRPGRGHDLTPATLKGRSASKRGRNLKGTRSLGCCLLGTLSSGTPVP